MELETTIYRVLDDMEITVFGDYEPGERGMREGGVPIEPDYPETIAVTGADDEDGNPVELTPTEERQAEDALWEALKEEAYN